MSIIEELKQRKVFRAAAIYAVVAWGILQVVDVISGPLSLPQWFPTMTIVLLGVGFPIALVFSWIFDIGPEGPTRTVVASDAPAGARGGFEVLLLLLLIVGIGWLIFRDISGTADQVATNSGAAPVVVLMDTYAARGVYDEETRRKSGTNADVLSDLLGDLPIVTQKEAIGSTWAREIQILRQQPALVLIHRSGFFHSMNQDLGIGYPSAPGDAMEKFQRLYQFADNKLVALLGYLARGSGDTKFIVYSRGTGSGWTDSNYRSDWIHQAEGRFPALKDRIVTIAVPGGTGKGSFRRADAAALIKREVRSALNLKVDGAD